MPPHDLVIPTLQFNNNYSLPPISLQILGEETIDVNPQPRIPFPTNDNEITVTPDDFESDPIIQDDYYDNPL